VLSFSLFFFSSFFSLRQASAPRVSMILLRGLGGRPRPVLNFFFFFFSDVEDGVTWPPLLVMPFFFSFPGPACAGSNRWQPGQIHLFAEWTCSIFFFFFLLSDQRQPVGILVGQVRGHFFPFFLLSPGRQRRVDGASFFLFFFSPVGCPAHVRAQGRPFFFFPLFLFPFLKRFPPRASFFDECDLHDSPFFFIAKIMIMSSG